MLSVRKSSNGARGKFPAVLINSPRVQVYVYVHTTWTNSFITKFDKNWLTGKIS